MSSEPQGQIPCPVCWTENDASRSTCELCGAELRGGRRSSDPGAASPPAPPPPAPAPPPVAAASAAPPEGSPDAKRGGEPLQEGSVIRGTWRIVRFLGEGGAGSVWVAEHLGLGHHVAIKTLVAKYVRDVTMKRRFLEEAVIQANVVHPNILRVSDIVDEAKFCAIVMEYADGGSLESWLEKHPDLGLNARLELFLGVLDGVGAAHAERIVHRDLKPANILIDTSAGTVTPKVTDFGIAKILSEGRRTETGMTMGTIHYAAPEQLTDARSVDHRADIYALGCTLYELVTGKVPFERDSVFGMMRAHLEAPRPDASQASPAVSRELALVIRRAMAIEPERRFASCAEFGAELREAMLLGAPQRGDVPGSARPSLAPPQRSLPGEPARPTTGEAAPRDRSTGPRSASTRSLPGAERRTRIPSSGPRASLANPRTRTSGRTMGLSGARPSVQERREFPAVQVAILSLALLILVAAVWSVARPGRGGNGAAGDWVNTTVGTDGTVEGIVGAAGGASAPSVGEPTPEPVSPPDASAQEAADAGPPPAQTAGWTAQRCREIADRWLEFNVASETPVSQAIDELDAASGPCREHMIGTATGEYERLTGLLVVDQMRYVFHHLRSLRDDAAGHDPCADAMMAASELQRGLRRVLDSIEGGFLLEYEIASVASRREQLGRMHEAHLRRWDGCTIPSLPAELNPLAAAEELKAEAGAEAGAAHGGGSQDVGW